MSPSRNLIKNLLGLVLSLTTNVFHVGFNCIIFSIFCAVIIVNLLLLLFLYFCEFCLALVKQGGGMVAETWLMLVHLPVLTCVLGQESFLLCPPRCTNGY